MNRLISVWQNLTPKDRKALILCLVFLTCIIIYLMCIEPLYQKQKDLTAQKNELLEKKRKYRLKSRLLPQRLRKLKETRTELKHLLKFIDIESHGAWTLPFTLNEVKHYAEMCEVTIEDVQPRKEVNKGQYWMVPLEVSFKGSFDSISKFLYYIETSPTVFVISELDIRKEKELSGKLLMSEIGIPVAEEKTEVNEPDLRVAISALPSSGPLFIAREKGWLQQGDIHIQILNPYLQKDHIVKEKMLLSEEIDVASSNMMRLIFYLTKGASVKGVLLMSYSHSTYSVVTGSNSSIKSIKDLTGKTLYFPLNGAAHDILFNSLKQNRMSLHDVTVKALEMDITARSLAGGLIENGIIGEPDLSWLTQTGYARKLYTPEKSEKTLDFLIVREEVLKNKKAAVKLLIEGYRKGLVWWREHKAEGNDIVAQVLQISPESLTQALSDVHFISDKEIMRKYICLDKGQESELKKTIEEKRSFFEAVLGYEVEIKEEELVDWKIVKQIVPCK